MPHPFPALRTPAACQTSAWGSSWPLPVALSAPRLDVCVATQRQTKPQRLSQAETGEQRLGWSGRRAYQVTGSPHCWRVLPLLDAVIAFLISGATKHGNWRLGLSGRHWLVAKRTASCPGQKQAGSGAAICALWAGGHWRGRSVFQRGLTVQ